MSAPSLKRYRVVATVWRTYSTVITATSTAAARAEADRLLDENALDDVFSFDYSGIDSVEVEEVE